MAIKPERQKERLGFCKHNLPFVFRIWQVRPISRASTFTMKTAASTAPIPRGASNYDEFSMQQTLQFADCLKVLLLLYRHISLPCSGFLSILCFSFRVSLSCHCKDDLGHHWKCCFKIKCNNLTNLKDSHIIVWGFYLQLCERAICERNAKNRTLLVYLFTCMILWLISCSLVSGLAEPKATAIFSCRAFRIVLSETRTEANAS